MMNERQRVRELEQLSAYLDGQLNETEKRQIESRLSSEPELREKYDGLWKTKQLFSRLPRVRAPRSFILTPEMVKVRKAKRPFTVTIRWATSVAAILLVVMFGAEFLLGNPLMARSAAPAEQMLESVAMEDEAELAEEAPAAKAADPEPLILWGAPGQGGGGGEAEAFGMGGAGGGDVAEEAAPLDTTRDSGEYPTESLPTDLPTQIETDSDGEGESPILGINPDQAGEMITSNEQTVEEPNTSWFSTLKPLRWAEIGLAVIAVIGAITLWIQRKQHP
jgi:hypothetical protein